MAPTLADRVKETTTSTGTGDLTLSGAVSGFQSFNAAIGTSTTFLYTVVNQDDTTEWETGEGQITTSTNFQRDTVIESSNSDAKVSFSSGTKDVFITPVATRAALLASGGRLEPAHATGLVLLATATASNDATVDFTSGIDGTYDEYVIKLLDVIPATDSTYLWIRTSTDGGSTWDSGSSDYGYYASINGTNTSSTSAAQIVANDGLGEQVGSDANETGISATMELVRPSAAVYTRISGRVGYANTGGGEETGHFSGRRLSAADVDGVRFLFSSGNIESGEFKLYGVVK